jgi:predicted alpha-1,2-mannosidase
MRSVAAAWALALAGLALAGSPAGAVVLRDVDPFVGVDGGGNVVPGPQVPFGFANPSPDTEQPATSGYASRGRIIGFSQTHVSGTGGAGAYGNFRLTPFTGPLRLDDLASGRDGERASPGRYGVRLARWDIGVQLTASRRAAVQRYRFPQTSQADLLLDVTSAVELLGGGRPVASQVQIAGRDAVEGWVRMTTGWGVGSYRLFFRLRATRPWTSAGAWRDATASDAIAARGGAGQRVGAWMRFDARIRRTVDVEVGLSFRSREQARRNLAEVGGGYERVARAAERRWQAALAPIAVAGGTAAERRMLSTSLYRTQLMPHDLSGENVWWRSPGPHYEDYYAIWDTFRTVDPLLTVIAPRRAAAIVQSLVQAARADGGWMPDARVAGNDGITQVGSDADVLVADALAKHLRGVDYRAAYAALRRDATVSSPHPGRYGRDLHEYVARGYLTTASPVSVSRTLEYGYDDFAVAQVARAFGDTALARQLEQRSLAWRALWDPATASVRPRTPDGSFAPGFDPAAEIFGSGPFFEGSGAQYSTFVPHDVGGLMRMLGGPDALVRWLDARFAAGLLWNGNEPTLLAPWLYTHAGRADRTAEQVQATLRDAFRPARDGLPGNDDSGTLSAWYVWGAIGLFPNAGQPYYYVTAPRFSRVTLHTGGTVLRIVASGAIGAKTRYVAAARLDGRPLRRAWITHAELARGGRLALTLTDHRTRWAADGPPPPSLTH